jgi:hypothetical protein
MFNDLLRKCLLYSPESAPRYWKFLNTTLFVYSGALLIILAFRDEGEIEYDIFAKEWYLTYDVVTCLVWLIETSLTMAQTWLVVEPPSLSSSSSSSTTTSSLIWYKLHIVEWILALYFLTDSIVRITKKVRGKGHTTGMSVDVSINLVAYGYIITAQYRARRSQHHDEGYGRINDNTVGIVVHRDHSVIYHDEKKSPSSYQLSV